ncbi:MAG: PLP-dependent aminotransferase family protein [Chloroflexota bacterium]|nr:PLP-dependent aminotransferase family protein [Chloroflexota bacterium]MDE3193348.1 PLP-dependent aminotransferase family protein [Chloroflexota bacterium]
MSTQLAGATRSILESMGNDPYGSFIDETIGIVARHGGDIVSFAAGSPAPEALALARVEELVTDVLARDGVSALNYGTTEGEAELREIIAVDARRRGIDASADDVIVTTGALQAIDLVCRVFLQPGDVVVAESPAFANALSAFRNHGAVVLEVPTDENGIDVAAAARAIRRAPTPPKLFFVVPNFQNPTGATLSEERRDALLALASSVGAVVVEDDPYGRLRYRGEDLVPIAARSRERVVHLGSFSKVFLPGIRVGWAVADPVTVRRMSAAKQTMDSSTSTLSQRLVVAFYRRGGVPAHIASLRSLYKEKQDAARRALTREFAGTSARWSDPDGGFYFWMETGVDARRFLDAALEEGVAFVPGDAFTTTGGFRDALRFSYCAPTSDRIGEGVRRLRRAFDRVADGA